MEIIQWMGETREGRRIIIIILIKCLKCYGNKCLSSRMCFKAISEKRDYNITCKKFRVLLQTVNEKLCI